jgi:anti-sigma factor RsiW
MTNSSRFSQVSDELLSAYLDQAVTAEERALVEAAIATDAEVAWRLETLRQTVALLKTLPLVALPRSFVLTRAQLVDTTETELSVVPPAPAQRRPQSYARTQANNGSGFWQVWRDFWQMGNPLLRNAAAVSLALLLVLLVGDQVQLGIVPTPAAPAASADSVQQPAAAPLPTITPVFFIARLSTTPEQPTAAADDVTQRVANQAANPVAPVAQAKEGITAKVAPHGEDQPVEMAPSGPETNQTVVTVQAAGVGGGETQEQKAAPAEPAAQAAFEQTLVTASAEISPAAFSPLAQPAADQPAADQPASTTSTATIAISVLTPATATIGAFNAYSVTTTVAEVALAQTVEPAPTNRATSPTVVVTPTNRSVAPTMTPLSVNSSPVPVQNQPATQLFPSTQEQSERSWRLAQLSSALLTLVLGGLWWRSRR